MKKVISLLCVAAMLLVFAGCGAQEKPDAVVRTFCEGVLKMDTEIMNQCLLEAGADGDALQSDEMPPEILELVKQHFQKITFTVQEPADEATTVSVIFQYPNLEPMLKPLAEEIVAELFGQAITGASEEEMTEVMLQLLVEQYNGFEAAMTERPVEFPCRLTEEGWKIEEVPEDLAYVILGDINKGMEEFENMLDEIGLN